MSTKEGKGGSRLPRRPPVKKQDGSPPDGVASTNLPSIDKFSFLEGIHSRDGNYPLHSTAIEDELNITEEDQANEASAGQKDIPKKTTNKQVKATSKRKETGDAKEKEPNTKRLKRTEGEVKTSSGGVTAGKKTQEKKMRSNPPAAAEKRLVGKRTAKKKVAVQTSAKRSGKSTSKNSQDNVSQEQRNFHQTSPGKSTKLSSDEEEENEDASRESSPKKTTLRLKKSSTDGRSPQGRPADTLRRKRPAPRHQTEFDVVLDAFLQFCEKYRESVESQQAQKSISTFSKNVEDQLLEKISSLKEFKVLKKENIKICSSIRTKTQRLVARKQELLGTEKETCQLEREKGELQHRLTLLKQGQTFLHNIQELNQRYMDHRHQHPHQQETYGASSLPALLLETKLKKKVFPQLKAGNTSAKKKTRPRK